MQDDLSFETQVNSNDQDGISFKSYLSISPNHIKWKGKIWNTDSICRIRWAVQYLTDRNIFWIWFGDKFKDTHIILLNNIIYLNFVDKLWKNVGNKIYFEIINGLRLEKKYKFNVQSNIYSIFLKENINKYKSALIYDTGIKFIKNNNLSSSKNIFYKWNQCKIYNEKQSFCIEAENNKISFSNFSVYNIVVLEKILKDLFKIGGDRISCILNYIDNRRSENNTNNIDKSINHDIDQYLGIFELKLPVSLNEIEKKYKFMLKIFHPDKYNHDLELRSYAEEKTKQLNNAYDFIKKNYFT